MAVTCKENNLDRTYCLSFVSPPNQEYFTHLKTSPLPVKGCKMQAFTWHLLPLSCHTCYDMGPISEISCECLSLCNNQGVLRTYSYPDQNRNERSKAICKQIREWNGLIQTSTKILQKSLNAVFCELWYIFKDQHSHQWRRGIQKMLHPSCGDFGPQGWWNLQFNNKFTI